MMPADWSGRTAKHIGHLQSPAFTSTAGGRPGRRFPWKTRSNSNAAVLSFWDSCVAGRARFGVAAVAPKRAFLTLLLAGAEAVVRGGSSSELSARQAAILLAVESPANPGTGSNVSELLRTSLFLLGRSRRAVRGHCWAISPVFTPRGAMETP